MDNGEVIPGLNEGWTLAGAKLSEWGAGFVMLLIGSEVIFTDKMTRSMPWLMALWIGTTFGLATLRRLYPDEERGIRNHLMVACGFAPPGIPAPSQLQPYWSGFPLRQLPEKCAMRQLGLDEVFTVDEQRVRPHAHQQKVE